MIRSLRPLLFISLLLISPLNKASLKNELKCLQQAYPEHIQSINSKFITWKDGTRFRLIKKENRTQQEKIDFPTLLDQIHKVHYPWGKPSDPQKFLPLGDPGRIRYEPFFKKMYGSSQDEIKKKLIMIYWMPKVFGKKYPLKVTTVNQVDQKLKLISDDLEELVSKKPEFKEFLDHPGGTFNWRLVANTQRLSPHSFGMSIDINSQFSNYWQWDIKKEKKPLKEENVLPYQNKIPWEIVLIFEKQGFIWGGKWQHYDSMHFEYRPELKECL